MKFIKLFLTPWVSLAFAGTPAQGQEVYISHCQSACPALSSPANEVLVRHLYAASLSMETGLAEWLAYRVLPGTVGVASLLPREWRTDELSQRAAPAGLTEGEGARLESIDLSEAQDREYRVINPRIDHGQLGRLAPMTSFAGTPYWEELNKMGNLALLPAALRQGSWSRLEQAINELAGRGEVMYVVAGPLTSANGRVEGFFKVVRRGDAEAVFSFASDLPPHADYCSQLGKLDELEDKLELSLFPGSLSPLTQSLAPELGCP